MAMNLMKGSILEDFECPVCLEYMFPPIRQCINGHSHCNDCFSRLQMCAQCRGHKVKSRNYTLEAIHAKVIFPCKYQKLGCSAHVNGLQIKEHEKYCDYSMKRCPLMDFDFCQWRGRKIEFIHHTQENHMLSVYFEPKKVFVAKAFARVYRQSNNNILFVVFNEIFRFTWEVEDATGCMKCAVYNIRRSTYTKFSYEIAFLDGNSGDVTISLAAPCVYCDVDLGPFVPGKYLMTHYDMLKDICDINGDLHYAVTISCNDAFTKFVSGQFNPKAIEY